MDKLSLIDVSSEDDRLISLPSASLALPISLDHRDTPNEDKGQGENMTEKSPTASWSSESSAERPSRKFNLRKSLAWDNAFFTNEGVLDCEELSIVNKAFKETKQHMLPAISEDPNVPKSCVESENHSLELKNLEIDLLVQMRTSRGEGNRIEQLPSFLSASISRIVDSKDNLVSSRELDNDTSVKKLSNSKGRNVTKQKTEKTSKDSPVCLGEVIKDCRGESISSEKPPKIVNNFINPLASRTESRKKLVDPKNSKKLPQKAAQGNTPSHGRGLRASCTPTRTLPRCSLRSPSSGSVHSSDTTPSLERSCSISSDSSVGSAGALVEGTRTANESRNAILSAYILSNSKCSQNISPASSIDGMSSDSSSSICSYKGLDMLGYPREYSCVNMAQSSASDDSSTTLHKPVNSPRNQNHSRADHLKPSGLRRPSPKIGFFDVATNSQSHNSSGIPMKSSLHTSSMKIDSDSSSRSNLPRYAPELGSSGSLHHATSPFGSRFRPCGPVTKVGTLPRVAETSTCTSRIQKPPSMKISKKDSHMSSNDSRQHTRVSDVGAKDQGVSDGIKKELRKSKVQSIDAGKDEDRCFDKFSLDKNGKKVSATSFSGKQAFSFDKLTGDDSVIHQNEERRDIQFGKDPQEQGFGDFDLSLISFTNAELKRSGGSPLIIKDLANSNEPETDLKYQDKSNGSIELPGQENTVSLNES